MNITRYLSPLRIWYLLKRESARRWKDYLITISAFCGFYLLGVVIGAKTGGLDSSLHYSNFGSILFLFGFIFTSTAFREAHKKLLNHDYLMLPASTLEKFVAKLMFSSVGFAVASVLVYWVFSLIGKLVVEVFLGAYYPDFFIFDKIIWQMIGHYFILQSIFMLGAVWFRKGNFIRTIISLILFSIILSVLSSLVAWLVFNDYFWTFVRGDFNFNIDFSSGFDMQRLEVLGGGVLTLFKIIYFGLLAPVCWFGSWLKLRELEVQDGV
ncbi:MAG: hypothetical protein JEZ04_20795 [Spirochaetales bacterium]|nr:hypothetical protein [Spirochaetales bacterium]